MINDPNFFGNLMSSVFINIIDRFSMSKILPTIVVPETAFLRIMGAINPKDFRVKIASEHRNFHEILFSLFTGFKSILKSRDLAKNSKHLKEMFCNFLRLKFCCLFTADDPSFKKNITVEKFFFMTNLDLNYGDFERLEDLTNQYFNS
jgi:hypothetical protein